MNPSEEYCGIANVPAKAGYGEIASVPAGDFSQTEIVTLAVEIRQAIERNRFLSLPVEAIEAQLSPQSARLIQEHSISLRQVLLSMPEMVTVQQNESSSWTVSCPDAPWLGPGPPPTIPAAKREAKNVGLRRGEATKCMDKLADLPEVQTLLRELAEVLLAMPERDCLLSDLGKLMSNESRNTLQSLKLRTAQLLRCFANDFYVENSGAASRVSYKHAKPRDRHIPSQEMSRVDQVHFSRMLKLAADVSILYSNITGISAPELDKEIRNGFCLVVDCRSDDECSVSMLPGAIRKGDLTAADFEGKTVVVAYCCMGTRAALWCSELSGSMGSARGMPSVCHLVGGVAAWAYHRGLFIEPISEQPTNMIHCWTAGMASFFPSEGYKVVCPLTDEDEIFRSKESLQQISEMRFARLCDLAWEVRIRYSPSGLHFEAEEVLRMLRFRNDLCFIDCRTEAEQRVSMIASSGCPVLTKSQFTQRFRELAQKPYVFIAYCTIGGRSGKLVESLQGDIVGTELHLRSVMGGLAAWLHVGGGLVDSLRMPTRHVHPWTHAFMDLFPVADLQMTCDELAPTPTDAEPFVECCPMAPESSTCKIIRVGTEISPVSLADTLNRAADGVCYED
eukprot:TRINITY_DN1608_c1_g3_i1.p1 TRINITY_DN1608_c1_g3~~TRINITY_DN1608_c1_g3_i1.p1  ORF type:complete len:620 (+),score=83.55 TRINITY_DN1608_c1_g3_i1:92-1951(+)